MRLPVRRKRERDERKGERPKREGVQGGEIQALRDGQPSDDEKEGGGEENYVDW